MTIAPQATAAPQPPAPPPPPGVATAAPAIAGIRVPTSKADVEALRTLRSELSKQITSASDRRDEAVRDLRRSPDGAARSGLEGRIAVLDQRIMQLEADLAESGRALAMAPTQFVGQPVVGIPDQRYGPFSPGQLTGITIVSIVFIWGPLAWAIGRTMLKRWAHPKPAPQVIESTARLERMEQAIDAVAIEVERISEGQRFVTQAMAKREAALALGEGQGAAQPLRVADAASVAR